jgi:hypothetical protein
MTDVLISDGKKLNDAVADKKQRSEPDPLIIADFETAKTIAEKLIPKHHPEIASANIIYLCRNKAQKQGGNPVPGTVKKASPLERRIGGSYFKDDEEPHFIMTIALDVWNDLQPNQRVALVDHLLTRCVGEEDEKSGEMKYSVRPPQVQEFPEVVERNGRWNDGLAELGDCLKGK